MQLADNIGGASRDRTDDLIVANDALSQLSYSPIRWTIKEFYQRCGLRQTFAAQAANCFKISFPSFCASAKNF
jgi:hypothetical protein